MILVRAIFAAFMICVVSAPVLTGCRQVTSRTGDDDDVVLAVVYDQKLTLADVRSLMGKAVSPEDSISRVRSHVEAWVRETLLLQEAEKNIPVDVNINKLVSDYRESLLLSNYENFLVRTLLDTVVTEAELREYYEKNKTQYQLDVPILRLSYARVGKPVPERERLIRWWNGDRPADVEAVRNYCRQHAQHFILGDSTWYRQPDVERMLPPGSLNGQNMSPGRTFRFSDREAEYYLKIHQRILSRDVAPLSYVGEQARRFILHKRKIDLLEKIKGEIYEREIKGDKVKIHI